MHITVAVYNRDFKHFMAHMHASVLANTHECDFLVQPSLMLFLCKLYVAAAPV